MKLEQLFAAIAPFLEGRASHAQAASALYGGEGSRDAQRLAIYGRLCRVHRFDAVDSTFEETRAAVLRLRGVPAWESIVADHFAAHPMHHAELNENASELPAWLSREAAARDLPQWVAELADLEWWSFRTRVAPDAPEDAAPAAGPLRLGATVDLRPYAHDLPAWLKQDSDRSDAPAARQCVVLFWRDLDLDTRFAEADPLELAILKAVFEKQPLAALEALVAHDALEETLADLRAAGILLGGPA